MTQFFAHEPVLLKEVLDLIPKRPGLFLVDATAGGGGHLFHLVQKVLPDGHVLGIDRDVRALEEDASGKIRKEFPKNVTLIHDNFWNLKSILEDLGKESADGIICDLGVSSHQLDTAIRGFSFQQDGPLDMRMDTTQGKTAYEWLMGHSEREIADTLYALGGERKSRQIAKAIKSKELVNSTLYLAHLITQVVRRGGKFKKIHPATRSFQAIRMAVNGEMEALSSFLEQAPFLLSPEGVLAIISFHSGEDRLIKQTFKRLTTSDDDHNAHFALVTKKPMVPTDEEIAGNKRARSAKLRAIRRLS